MNTITILPDHNKRLWIAHHNDPSIQKLFGTAILPTPYTLNMSKAEVIKLVQGFNLEKKVI